MKKKIIAVVIIFLLFFSIERVFYFIVGFITIERYIICNKSENVCKVADITLADILTLFLHSNGKSNEQLNSEFKKMENKINKSKNTFRISDIVGSKCEVVHVEKNIGNKTSYQIDYGDHNVVYQGYRKRTSSSSRHRSSSSRRHHSSSSKYYVRIPQYEANLQLKHKKINLKTQFDTRLQCEALCNDILQKIDEAPNNEYIQVFGGGVNKPSEEKVTKQVE